ncbi:MAG: hypothetical protein ACYCSP_08385 [Acidobacteriaceae bacterium]
MTAEAFAEILSARPAGRGRWLAKCPSHADRHPSLSITQGHSAILLKCWSAGCSTEQIVTALGLPMSALFDAPLTPATRREVELRRAKKTLEASRQRRKRIALMKGYRACTRRMAGIADAFFNGDPEMPDELGREYHECLDFQRAVEVEVFS